MEHTAIVKDQALELSLVGKFTFSDSKAFNDVLREISSNSYKQVIIDLKLVDFIDSAALGILLLTRDKCDKSNTDLIVRNPKGQVRQMFDISRFSDLFDIQMEDKKKPSKQAV